MQLRATHVDSDDVLRPALEKAVGEAPRRGTGIETQPIGHIDTEMFESTLEFQTTARHETGGRRNDGNRIGRGHERRPVCNNRTIHAHTIGRENLVHVFDVGQTTTHDLFSECPTRCHLVRQELAGDCRKVVARQIEVDAVDRSATRLENTRPHLRIFDSERTREASVGARTITHHHLDASVNVRHQRTSHVRHGIEGFSGDSRFFSAGISKGREHRATSGPSAFGSWIQRIIVRTNEPRTLQQRFGSDTQSVETESSMKGNNDDVDLGGASDPAAIFVFDHVVNVDHVDAVVTQGLQHPGTCTHERALSRPHKQCRGHCTGDHVSPGFNAEAGQFGFLLLGRRRSVVGHEYDSPSSALQSRHRFCRALDRGVCPPNHAVQIAEDHANGLRCFANPRVTCHP